MILFVIIMIVLVSSLFTPRHSYGFFGPRFHYRSHYGFGPMMRGPRPMGHAPRGMGHRPMGGRGPRF